MPEGIAPRNQCIIREQSGIICLRLKLEENEGNCEVNLVDHGEGIVGAT